MNQLLRNALAAARETRALRIGNGVLSEAAPLFREQFGNRLAVIVADPDTFAAAGRAVGDNFRANGIPQEEPFLFTDPGFYAEHSFVEKLEERLSRTDAVPVAVGAGAINDVAKLASHRKGRSYLAVATAASMDGYTAFGASITFHGSKQTFSCPAPRAVLADIGVIAAAPPRLNAAGYADLAAKITAGADWIVADALGIEPIDPTAWSLVQEPLRGWLGDPSGIRGGNPEAIRNLVEGLMMGGFAMQWTQSSRCASGAEHQFSHLWDMQHHTHHGSAPSHGFKVGVATLAVTRLYEQLLRFPLDTLDVEAAVAAWPSWPEREARLRTLYAVPEITEKALEETRAKHPTPEALRAELGRMKAAWPGLRQRLAAQLLPSGEFRQSLSDAGAPVRCEEIGISMDRLRRAHYEAAFIRRRFTVLDLALRTGTLESALREIYPAQD